MSKQKLTVFQKLGQVVGPNGPKQKQQQIQPVQRFSLSNGQLLKTDNKAEYETAKLQAQQGKFLQSSWKKVENGLFQQSINYETTRVAAYADFEAMEYYPTIAAAIDTISEEACTVNDRGIMLNIYSDSSRVKGILEDLFYNRLDIHTSLPMFTRNMVKYGDNFVLLNIDPDNGILGGKQMPNYEMERREGGLFDMIYGREIVSDNKSETDKVKFFWRGRDIEFNSWQIAHFRLLGDDRKLPYGCSLLDKARRIWKQLCVSENTKVWTTNGYKLIKDIDLSDEIYSFDYNTNKLIKTKINDCWHSGFKTTYKVRTKYNHIDVTDDHKILTYDGVNYLYKKIDELNIGKDRLVIPTITSENKIKKLKLESDGYYIKLNTFGKNKAVNLNRNGIIKKIKSINEKDYKNIHRFIQGNGKVKYSYLQQLNELFDIDYNDIDVYYSNTKTILNKKLEYEIDSEFVRFIGFMLGDGWLTGRGIGFALGMYPEQNDYYINYCKNKFNKDVFISQNTSSVNSKSALIFNKEIKNIFTSLGFISGYSKKRIPNWVFKMDLNVKRNLIQGLFDADGSDKYGVIGLANENLINDLKELCLQSGIGCGKITKKTGSTIFNQKTNKNETRQDSFKLYINFNNITDNIRYEKIIDVIKNEPENVWDLEVDNYLHNFIANGSVIHNCQAEDAMLVYRVTRAPERRVYKIFVGNMDNDDIPAYVDAIANRFKRTPIIDPQTGQMDLRFNQMTQNDDFFIPVRTEDAPNPIDTLPGACIALDTRIPLLDGRTLELQEIINEWDNGNRNLWVYSCDPKTGALSPGMISWAGITRKNTQVLKITLDNGETIVTTPDHKFVHRTKEFVEAKDLVVGDSLMPFYTDEKKINNSKNKYKVTWDSSQNKWVYDHRMVVDFMKKNKIETTMVFNDKYLNESKTTIHHKDINRYNNNPENLVLMNNKDHYEYHSISFGTVYSKIGSEAFSKKMKEDTDFRNKRIETSRENTTNMWKNFSDEKRKDIRNKMSISMTNFIENLSEEERDIRNNRIKEINIKYKDKAIESFNNNPNKSEIIKIRSEKQKITKNSLEFKEKASLISKKIWEQDGHREKVFTKEQKLTFSDKLYEIFFITFEQYGRADLTISDLNNNIEFMSEFYLKNKDIRSSLTNLNSFTKNHLNKMLKHFGFLSYRDWCKKMVIKLGYKNVRAWRYFILKNKTNKLYNHKITNIEILSELQDTGTITVDGDEIYHDNHTFAIESGVFIKNSNLSDIEDINYLQRNLFTALRVPKSFLGFEEATGDGKNLALQDIRFSRTINRVQQSVLQELNKIAIIHLYLLGFEDDLSNFTLTLNNPSTQAEMLKIEQTQLKVTLFKDATSDLGNGFAPMSMTRAHREIFGWSDNEIKQDLLEQRMEKAAAAELENTSAIIKHTGMFDVVDRIYGDYTKALEGGAATETSGDGSDGPSGGGGGLGGSFGGGSASGEDLDFGDETETETPEEGAEEEVGAETPEVTEPESVPEPMGESIKKVENLLTERKKDLTKTLTNRARKYSNRFVNMLVESVSSSGKPVQEKVKIYNKNVRVNDNVNDMVKNIDKMLGES